MKKVLFCMLAVCMVALAGCSKEDEPKSNYSEYQKKAFSIFNGTWADIQFSNLKPGLNYLPEPDKIVFGKHYDIPEEVYKDDFIKGKVYLYDKQGECLYYEYDVVKDEYEITECYYEINPNADYLRLYKRSDNRLFERYDMYIESDTRIRLHDPDLSLPYIFVKQ